MKQLFVNRTAAERTVNSRVEINKRKTKTLYWFFEPGGSNSSLQYLPMAHRAGFGPSGALKMAIPTNPNGVCDHDQFRLSVAGLDTFKVQVGLKRDGSDKKTSEEYKVWRRIYYSVRYMKPDFLFDFGPVHTEYLKHGIEPKKIAPGGGAAKVAYTEILRTYAEAEGLVQPVTEAHLEARIVLVDRVWIVKKREFTYETPLFSFVAGGFARTNDPNTTVEPSWILWPRAKFAKVSVRGTGMPAMDITAHVTRASDRTLKIDVPDTDPAFEKMRDAVVHGDLTYSVTAYFIKVLNGFANSEIGRIVIATRTRDDTPREVAPRQGTMIHEMGHGFGMVPPTTPQFNEYTGKPFPGQPKANPKHYQNGGGHCSQGAGGSSPDFSRGACVMYHAGWDGRPHAFCANCAPIVKRLNMNRNDMLWP
ncbi:MAG: hypothetical protein U0704_12515 [Candidatus Eisenbacteria bacterium]